MSPQLIARFVPVTVATVIVVGNNLPHLSLLGHRSVVSVAEAAAGRVTPTEEDMVLLGSKTMSVLSLNVN